MSKVERLERIEGGRGYAKEFTTKLGEKLGWMDGATMYTKKIGNTELMGITAFDDKFTAQHNRMAELLEAYYKFRGKYIDESSSLDIAEIYEGVERKQPIKVSVRASAGAEMREMDIKEIARLLRMKQLNSFLGKYAIPEKTLEETFFAGGELVVNISSDDGEEGREIDFYKMCPMDSMEDFDFEGYLKNIRKNQIGLQWMGNIRDEALQKHHIENAGHSLFKKINRVKTLTGHDEHLWIPVCETLAKENARGDLQKTDTSFKAGGHVHEFVQYNEDTGASVKIEFDLIQKHRAGIDYRSFQKTLPRTYKAAVGMTQNEFASVTEELVEFGESDKKETKKLKIFDIGANGGGDIYKGMRSTYDRGTKAVRGFSLSKDEIDDRILTDIIGPWVTNNANDWLMCLAQSINGSINYDILKAVSKGGGDWEKNFGFCVRIRCKNNNGEVEPRNFRSVHELIDYINQRIKKGEIAGVSTGTSIPGFTGMSKEEISKADQEIEGLEAEEIQNEFLEKVSDSQLKAHSHLFRKIFGSHAEKAAENFMDKGLDVTLKDGDNSYGLMEYVDRKLRGMSFNKPEDYCDLVKPSQQILNEDEARKQIMAVLSSMAEITSEERQRVESSKLDPDKKREALENLMKNKKESRKRFLKLVKEGDKKQADSSAANKKK